MLSDESAARAPGRDAPERVPADLAADGIRRQLTRILGSQAFAHAPMLRRLLQHLVEHTLSGAQELKEYAVGVDVFDRGSAFDPRTDTIVRVQARRLRAKLDEYYRSEGAADAVLIVLPKGRYLVEYRAAAASAEHPEGSAPVPDEQPSIVVLPFVNLNADQETEFLTDGLTEELIGTLASVAELKVVARTSAFHFKGRTDDIRKIGQELGVRMALEGSVRIHQQRMRVMAQLIDLTNGLHLWSEAYDRRLGAVFDIQEEIARAIVDAMRVRLAPGGSRRFRSAPPQTLDAYDHFLKGRYYFHRLTPVDMRKSIEHLERAVTLAPEYAAAHAALAESYVMFAGAQIEAPQSFLASARAAAQRALALEPSAEAHAAMGAVLALADLNGQDSERAFQRALALKPSYAMARGWYAVGCLYVMRRYRDAIDQLKECLSVDPLSVIMRVMLGQTLILAAEFDAAAGELRHALTLDPDFAFGHVTLGLAQLAKGSYHEARQTLLQVEAAAQDFPNFWGHLGYAQAKLGQRLEAERALRELNQRFRPWVPNVDAAAVHNALGDTRRALECLESARLDRSYDWLFIADDPRLTNLSSNPEFQRLLPSIS
jgi:serine/threonine-protein kinase